MLRLLQINRHELWRFANRSLDVTQGRKYESLKEDRPQYSIVIDLGRQDC